MTGILLLIPRSAVHAFPPCPCEPAEAPEGGRP